MLKELVIGVFTSGAPSRMPRVSRHAIDVATFDKTVQLFEARRSVMATLAERFQSVKRTPEQRRIAVVRGAMVDDLDGNDAAVNLTAFAQR